MLLETDIVYRWLDRLHLNNNDNDDDGDDDNDSPGAEGGRAL